MRVLCELLPSAPTGAHSLRVATTTPSNCGSEAEFGLSTDFLLDFSFSAPSTPPHTKQRGRESFSISSAWRIGAPRRHRVPGHGRRSKSSLILFLVYRLTAKVAIMRTFGKPAVPYVVSPYPVPQCESHVTGYGAQYDRRKIHN